MWFSCSQLTFGHHQEYPAQVKCCYGVESFDIDLKEQKVTVKGNVEPDEVLQAVSKSGKKTAFWVDEAPQSKNKPLESAPVASENKPSEAATVASAEPENKPSEAAIVDSAEPENKPSDTVVETVA
ncbi:copper chaperone homolog CCH isoform X1 [Glycine max]|uniref:Copper transport protein CCH isoform B n=1 Tax=Glycine soja TaxID=3848 RepID=A0A445LPW0_GLYSO|nr:copper chaperone homolog CCH isoform X1 [Glycine max]RZC25235.1 Copper transport protein CCH isoform B [Glycine soja]|eukprot:XP_025980143.1 copper chaperone homolog CCH isoform X1 [Glycine max]